MLRRCVKIIYIMKYNIDFLNHNNEYQCGIKVANEGFESIGISRIPLRKLELYNLSIWLQKD